MKIFKHIIILLSVISITNSYSQCNTNTTICTPGVAGPFNFVSGSPNPSSCLDYWNGQAAPNYAYIILYITNGGSLNLLISANSTGFLDVAVFDITGQANPCASLSIATEISCNYASTSQGCSEFGSTFPGCGAEVPAPMVSTGDVLMILVEDWSNTQTNFTLELSNTPGSAQTGPPNTTINPVGPFCTTAPLTQLTSVNMGGVWSGPGISSTGVFNPAAAGPGTHTITYSLGVAPCNSTSTTTITVIAPPIITPVGNNITCFGACDGTADAGISGATYIWSPGGQTTQTISGLCPGTYTVTVTQAGCTSTGNITITEPPIITTGPISHD